MAALRIEPRSGGSLLLTQRGRVRWGFAIAGLGAGSLLLTGTLGSGVSMLGAVVIVPLALIVILAGLAAARHRDWMLFDRAAGEIVFRRGLGSIFRSVSAVPFDEVEAIVVDPLERPDEGVTVALLREGDFVWPLDTSGDPAYVGALLTALHEVGGWTVLRDGVPLPVPYRIEGRTS